MRGSTSSARTINALIMLTFARGVSSSIAMTFLSLYAYNLGYSLADVGFFSTFGSAGSILSLPLLGFIADVVGRRPVAVLSGFLTGFSLIAPVFYPNFLGFLLAYLLLNTSLMSWQPARGAMVADAVPEEHLGLAYAKISTAFAATRTFIPLIAGYAILKYGYETVFLAASAITLMVTVIFMLVVGETKKGRSESEGFLREFIYSLKPRRDEVNVHLVLAIDRVGRRIWFPILSPYLKVVFGLDESGVGAFTTLRSIAQLLFLTPSGRLVDKYGGGRMLGLSQVLVLFSTLLLIIPGNLIVGSMAMVLLGSSIALTVPSYNVLVAVTVKNSEERGRAYSRVNLTRQTSAMPMPWIGGMLSNILITLPLIISAGILGINGILCYKLFRKNDEKA